MFRNHKRKIFSVVLLAVLVTVIFGFATPRPAQAQFGGAVAVLSDIPATIFRVLDRIADFAKEALKRSIAIAYKNNLRGFLGRVAEDTAIWLASGAPGQKPLFIDQPGQYFREIGDATAADFADSLSSSFFGKTVAQLDFDDQVQVELNLRSLLSPATFCRDTCLSTYDKRVATKDIAIPTSDALNQSGAIDNAQELAYFENEIENLKTIAKTSEEVINIPLYPCNAVGIPNDPPQSFRVDTGPSFLEPAQCIRIYQFHTSQFRQSAQQELTKCNQKCTYDTRSREQVRNDTRSQVESRLAQLGNAQASQFVSNYFDPSQNQIGQLISAYTTAQKLSEQSEQEERDVLDYGNLGPVRSKVTGRILTTADLVLARAKLPIEESTTAEQIFTGITEDILAGAASYLTNTLIGKLTDRYFDDRCGLNPEACAGPVSSQSRQGSLLFDVPTGIAAARIQFASLAKINYIVGDPSRDEILVTEDLVSRGIIDSRFKQAVEERLTIGQALDKGLLDGDIVFGFDENGQEPDNSLSYTSLLYLRKNRIIPVGWELAAKYNQINPQGSENLTLSELVTRFSQCNPIAKCSNNPSLTCFENQDCSTAPTCADITECPAAPAYDTCQQSSGGTSRCMLSCVANVDCTNAGIGDTCDNGFCIDSANTCQVQTPPSPYCGLIDPDWVLKAPQSYCQRKGAGEEIVARDFVCDEDSNDDQRIDCSDAGGDIGRWIIQRSVDYCADEKSCIAENDDGSCRSYGYCYQERPTWKFDGEQCDRQFVSCDTFTDPEGVQASYLTNTLDHYNDTFCNGAAGCKWYCRQPDYDLQNNASAVCDANNGSKLNLTRATGVCDASNEGCTEFIRQSQGPNLLANGNFEFLGPTDVIDDPGPDVFPNTVTDTSWSIHTGGGPPVAPNDYTFFAVSNAYLNDTAMRVPSNGAANAHLATRTLTGYPLNGRAFTFSYYAKNNGGVCGGSTEYGLQYFINPVGTQASKETANYTSEWQRFSISRIVPSTPVFTGEIEVFIDVENIGCELLIDGAMLQEISGLGGFTQYVDASKTYMKGTRQACTEDEVGCELYTPLKGGDIIPGVVRADDRCSADVAGCSAWNEQEITRVPFRQQRQVNYVSGTGSQCSAQYVGCEEYTNLNKVAAGGEAREYYTIINQCVTPSNPNATALYYTWEGNDVTGYQLRAHEYLIAADGSPCTQVTGATPNVEPSCAGTDPVAVCTQTEFLTDPDCTEYFDAVSQNSFLRRRSMTIQVSDTCNPYRNTINTTDNDPNNDDTIYYIDGEASIPCPGSAAGCREYRGDAGNNVRIAFSDNFDDGDIQGWTGGTISNESVRVGGHSIRIDPAYADVSLDPGHNYKVTMWAKAQNNGDQLSVWLRDEFNNPVTLLGTLTLTDDWNLISFGPGIWTGSGTFNQQLFLTTGGVIFADNIKLINVADTEFVVQNTYQSCTAGDVGCAEYADRSNQRHYLKSFTRLCSNDVVGCEALINTHNSDNPYAETYLMPVTVPQDSAELVVVSPAHLCKAEFQGCEGLGQPTLDEIGNVVKWNPIYLINEPDRYNEISCHVGQIGCEEWISSTGAQSSFIDPGPNTCSFDELGSGSETWNQTNTPYQCPTITPPPEGNPVGRGCVRTCNAGVRLGGACVTGDDCPGGACQGDNSKVGLACTQDFDCYANPAVPDGGACQYWAGLCPTEQTGCNEYRDPLDPSDCLIQCPYLEINGVARYYDQSCNVLPKQNGGVLGCRPYYYLRSTVEDTAAECGTTIDPTIGCQSFYDTSNPNLNFRGG
ncbi:hypothetical protein ACFL04_03790 [Patescibacteria group bacterium]